MTRPPFHLSFPVDDLDACRTFYAELLGASVGRVTEEWVDIVIWGHQLTLQLRPDEVLAPSKSGSRHFGVILPWEAWSATAERLTDRGCTFMTPPTVSHAGTPKEQGKLYLEDPAGNVIEIKAYRDVAAAIHPSLA